jgi:hypothetical protein
MKILLRALILMLVIIPAIAAVAQTTNVEVKKGTVVAAFNDQLIVKMSTGETKQITVPAGFMFNVDGKPTALADLKPGTEITATVTNTETPHTVKTTEIRNGEVVRVVGNTVWIRENGKVKSYPVPKDFKFNVDGQQVGVDQLRPGYKVTAEIIKSAEHTVKTRTVEASGTAPAPPPEPIPVVILVPVHVESAPAPAEPAPAPAPAEEKKLPATASQIPLVGLVGLLLVGAGIAVRRSSLN